MTKLGIFVLFMGIVNFFVCFAVIKLIFNPDYFTMELYLKIVGVMWILNLIYTKFRDMFIYRFISN